MPRDLSGIFEEINSRASARPGGDHNTSASPASLASQSASGTPMKKRMLGRAATLPNANAFGASPMSNGSPLLKTSSLPVISPSKKVEKTPTITATLDLSPSNVPAPSHTATLPRPNVRTYSQARSFLVAIPPSPGAEVSETQTNAAESQDLHRESYADLRRRFRVDVSSDDEIGEGLMGPLDLKSISELRDKGENRRFLDEIGYLLEGFDSKMTIPVKRLSALKLLENMCTVEFMRRVKAADALGSAWMAMRKSSAGTGDKVQFP
ncbi:hypothetical protein BS47DRAFT_740245 [Hydnum rufescens UP504]|uniref:Wings apart-like protein C-terminal domain-containing protein n=1 Tax=Hydnum rufescens UP504 TaxID=1448309 RepID=A0A9P6B1D4_9AGAM|nr:hypothetical protein BS47DRAFT_740245 [Hydnum rufescens UP504]